MTQNAPTASPAALEAERMAENEIDRLLRVEGNLRAANERLRAALRVARQWMPVHCYDKAATEDVALVDAALEPKP